MNVPVFLSDEARADWVELLEYVAHQSASNAAMLNARIDAAIHGLTIWPKRGRERPDLRRGIRSVPVSGHTIFYEFRNQRVEILRILRASRNTRSAVLKRK